MMAPPKKRVVIRAVQHPLLPPAYGLQPYAACRLQIEQVTSLRRADDLRAPRADHRSDPISTAGGSMRTPTDRPDQNAPRGRLARLASLAYRRRRAMLAAWLVALVAVVAVAPRIAGEFTADYSAPGSDSQAARQLVEERFGGFSGETVDVVWESPAGAGSPEVRGKIDGLVKEAQGLEGIERAIPAAYSRDGTTGVIRLELDRAGSRVPVETGEELIDRAEQLNGPNLTVGLAGQPIDQAEGGPGPESTGVLAAMAVLLVVFGSLVAAGLPLAVALFGLGISTPLIGVLAGIATVPEWATAVAGLIGVGVGIDYALLVLTRFRAALDRGSSPELAVGEAVTTAGRSVLIAGGTVIVSMLGLFVLGLDYMNGVALSASLAVLVVMSAAITLLPALLAFAGHRVDSLRIPLLGRRRRRGTNQGELAARWSRGVQRRPWAAIVAGTAVLVLLSAPVLGIRLGFPDAGNGSPDNSTRVAYDLTAEGFGKGANGPLMLAAELPGRSAAQEFRGALNEIRELPGVASVSEPRINPQGDAAIATITPTTSPQSDVTADLVHRLRDDVLPKSLGAAGITARVGGTAALVIDQSDYLSARLPVFVGAVVGVSLLLLVAAFRAPLIAVKAGVMNLLSVAAAFGVLSLAAEGGFLSDLLGIEGDVPVPPFIPVMMFAILFGLSMDYEVFLLSRVREEYAKLRDNSSAVTEGLARTARVITAAAAIMVVVFLSFAVSDEVFLRLFGVGMATAILVDATIIRMVLVPAVMQVLGRANWWMPRWLDRIVPRIDPEARVPEGLSVRERPAEA
jgi:putative drug exporter of the RND superfamily